MLLSIVLPIRDGALYIEDCFNSINEIKDSDVELIVIVGPSLDNTEVLLSKFFFMIDKLLFDKGNGIYEAMNQGIEVCSGSFISIIGVDDRFDPNFLSIFRNYISVNPFVKILYGNLTYTDTAKLDFYPRGGESLPRTMIPHPSLIAHVDVYASVGSFSTKYRVSADYDWALKALDKGFDFNYLNSLKVYSYSKGFSKNHAHLCNFENLRIRFSNRFFPFFWTFRVYIWTEICLFFHLIRNLFVFDNTKQRVT